MTARRKLREEIAARTAALEKRMQPRKDYRLDPVGYIRDVLKARLTPVQEEACQKLLEHPYRVAIKSGHGVGKSFIAAAVINWRFDSFDPGVVISTAPTWQAVKDVLWTEVRLQRMRVGLGGFRGEMMPLLYSSPDHWAQGITANPASMGAAFQGRHRANMAFVFDEAVGVKAIFFVVAETMFRPVPGNMFLAIYNPTDPSSCMFLEEKAFTLAGTKKWHSIQFSSLDHVNIAAELAGREPPIPQAVRLAQVEAGVAQECDPIAEDESEPGLDLLWPPPGTACPTCKGGRRAEEAGDGRPGLSAEAAREEAGGGGGPGDLRGENRLLPDDGRVQGGEGGPGACPACAGRGTRPPTLYRPSPVFESRWLGRWPSGDIFGVWSDRRFASACKEKAPLREPAKLPRIGVDVACHGDDYSAFATCHGFTALGLERHNGWEQPRVVDRCVELAEALAAWATRLRNQPTARPVDPKSIPINVDDVGMGGGVVQQLQLRGFFARGVGPQLRPLNPDRYASTRDELWFALVERARTGRLDLSACGRPMAPPFGGSAHLMERLRNEALAPVWEPTAGGQRKVESKKDMKKRLPNLGSPDLMDALNLAFYDAPLGAPVVLPAGVEPLGEREAKDSGVKRREWFGM